MNIAAYLQRLSRQLTVVPAKREQILEEVNNHLLEIADRLREQGVAQDQSEAQAIAEFGSVGSVAAQINRVHPIQWDLRRTLVSMAIGAAITFTLSTLITSFFLLVSTRAQIISSLAWDIIPFRWDRFFLDATPGSFTVYNMLIPTPYSHASPYAPALLTLFLLLYGLTPFLWGCRAARGWQAGLAYGLGGAVGTLWLIPGTLFILFQQPIGWDRLPEPYKVPMLLTWLLVPFAVLASSIGQRFFNPFATVIMKQGGMAQQLRTWLTFHIFGQRRIVLLSMSLALVILLFANMLVISQIISTRVSPSILATQLDAARQQIVFPIREPHQLPQGLRLRKIEYGPTSCGYCSIDLEYSDADGRQVRISEEDNSNGGNLIPSPLWPKYWYATDPGFIETPIWWMPTWKIFHDHSMTTAQWSDGKVTYVIDFWGNFSQGEIHQMINEIGHS